MNNDKKISFPKNFLWGTATSAYQIEGGITNDWSQWERSPARLKALMREGKNSSEFICDRAADSYHKYKEDLDLAVSLNNNAIRFGLEWARIQPNPDTWDVDAIKHYRDLLVEAKKRGLKTFVTLWHWTNPLWITSGKKGGWEDRKTVERYLEYVQTAIQEFGSEVDHWITLNEPLMFIYGGYLSGRFPPNKKNPLSAQKVIRNLAKANNGAYDLIHKHFPNAQVGYSSLINFFEPARKWCPVEVLLAKSLHYYWNERFFKRTKGKFDFIGANYYFHDRIIWYPPFKKNEDKWTHDKGWEIYPEGIYQILKYVKKFNKPIYITENGLADREDKHRKEFIKQHLLWTHKAISEGADVRGYFHWSLLDNFEWDSGYDPKFGLFEVDRLTHERKPRPSAEYYAEICKNNELEI